MPSLPPSPGMSHLVLSLGLFLSSHMEGENHATIEWEEAQLAQVGATGGQQVFHPYGMELKDGHGVLQVWGSDGVSACMRLPVHNRPNTVKHCVFIADIADKGCQRMHIQANTADDLLRLCDA